MPSRYGESAKANADAIKEAQNKKPDEYQSRENMNAAIDLLDRYEYFIESAELTAARERLWNKDGTRRDVMAAAHKAVAERREKALAAVAARKADAAKAQATAATIDRIEIPALPSNGRDPEADADAVLRKHAPTYQEAKRMAAAPDDDGRIKSGPEIGKELSAAYVQADAELRAHVEAAANKPVLAKSRGGIPYEYAAPVPAGSAPAPAIAVDLDTVSWVVGLPAGARAKVNGFRVNKGRIRLPARFMAPEYAYMRLGLAFVPEIDVAIDTVVLQFRPDPAPGFSARHKTKPEWCGKAMREAAMQAGYTPGEHPITETANCVLVTRSYDQ